MTRTDRETRGVQVRRRLTDQERLWRSVTESDVLHAVMDYIQRIGGYAYRQNSGAVVSEYKGKKRFIRYGEPGASDIVAVVPRTGSIGAIALFIECKDETGKQSPAQRDWQTTMEIRGAIYIVCRPSNWQEQIDQAIGVLE